jgi:hypothetical protein
MWMSRIQGRQDRHEGGDGGWVPWEPGKLNITEGSV